MRFRPKKTDYFLTTYSGARFYPTRPASTEFRTQDIAHALSLICRFAGHVSNFYSVAQHSVHVSELVEPRNALRALLHDASEAYLVDLPTGVKYAPGMEGYRALEARTMDCLLHSFGFLDTREPPQVKRADLLVLRAEAKHFGFLKPDWSVYDLPDIGLKIVPWSPEEAESRFTLRFLKVDFPST